MSHTQTLPSRNWPLGSNPAPVEATLEDPRESIARTSPPALPEMVDALKHHTTLIVEATTVAGEHICYRQDQLDTDLADALERGVFERNSPAAIHAKNEDGEWEMSDLNLGVVIDSNFQLRKLYKPVWSCALAGLKWGTLCGIVLKLLDTSIALAMADPSLAVLFVGAVAACLIPRIGLLGVAAISFVMLQFSPMNFFVMGLSAAAVGAALGCLPGMAVGGLIGLASKESMPRARDAAPAEDGSPLATVVLPGIGGLGVWILYLNVLNPWIVSMLENQ